MSDPHRPIPEDLESAPPSCKYVYRVLAEAHDPIPRQELVEETYLPESTVDRALDHLQNEGYLLRTRESPDLRQVSYHIER